VQRTAGGFAEVGGEQNQGDDDEQSEHCAPPSNLFVMHEIRVLKVLYSGGWQSSGCLARPLTGGAGYVGSHFAALLEDRGIPYIVADDLRRSGGADFVPSRRLVCGDVGDEAFVRSVCREYQVDVAVHYAGYTYVGESVQHPEMYY